MALDNLRSHKFTHLINIDREMFPTHRPHITAARVDPELTVDASDPSVQFEILDLHFGERHIMTVLPNIYKAVKFIEKSLENSGKVLIGEYMGQQKAVTIVIAFIMYKFRLNFVEAFQIVRKLSSVSTMLDTYFIAQLCEYEPILETQRRAMLGSSCSSELRTAKLKRKRLEPTNSPIKTTSDLPILCAESTVDNASRDANFNNNTEPIQNMET